MAKAPAPDPPPTTGRESESAGAETLLGVALVILGSLALWGLQAAGIVPRNLAAWEFALIFAFNGLMYDLSVRWLDRKPESNVRLQIACAVTVLLTAYSIYATGLGPLVIVIYVSIVIDFVRHAGVRAIKVTTIWVAVSTALGELAVQLRPHISIVRPAVAHSAAVVGVLALLLVVVVLNRAATRSADLEQQIKDRAERFAALLRYAADIICLIDIDGTLIFVSPAVKHVLLYTPEELVGTSVSLLLEPQATQRLLEGVSGFMSSPGVPFQDTVSLLARDGSERIAEITVTNPGGFSPHEVIVNVHDITTQRLLEARLRHDAMHDQLTGLMNRAAVVDAAERAFARASRNGTSVGVLYIDLDGFKAINDTCGHDAGDLVLIEVAARIQRCLRGGEAVGRLGGDEFAIVIEPLTDLHIATEIATRLVDEIGAPITLVPSAQLGASVGIARFPIDGETVEAVFASADEAMYSAKRAGRRQWAMSSHSGAGLKRPRLVG